MSKILPILFNAEMVRAILDGRKTNTRRAIKFPEGQTGRLPENGARSCIYYPGGIKQPPYQIGDILYVRETIWQMVAHYLDAGGETLCHEFKYAATDKKPEVGGFYSWVKRPSIHMPKEAARIWLKVTDVRAERLKDIKYEDVMKEGISAMPPITALDEFADLWNSTIQKQDLDHYGWNANPWVWVIEFERCQKPESEG